MKDFNEQDRIVFDGILKERHSTRIFTDKMVEKYDIESIINSGIQAPFASVSASDVDVFRHFFPLPRTHKNFQIINELIKAQSQQDLNNLNAKIAKDEFIKEHSQKLHGLWSMVAEKGIPGFMDASYLIVVAEWAGARRAEKQSLAHVMQNMWLKATALNLGFCLVSVLESMSDNSQFCELFNLPPGRYGFHGCLVGYKKNTSSTSPKAKSEVHWTE